MSGVRAVVFDTDGALLASAAGTAHGADLGLPGLDGLPATLEGHPR
ncbi:hypothetical protein [Streptomyces sp. NPDC054961]